MSAAQGEWFEVLGGSVEFRTAVVEDAEAISALVLDLSASFFVSPTRDGAEPFLASISPQAQRHNLSAPNFSYLLAEVAGELAGVIALRDHRHLFHLFVARRYQRAGLAQQLWRTASAYAVAHGNEGRFTVNSSLNAVPVYERWGFVRCGDVQMVHGVKFQPMDWVRVNQA